VSYTLMASRAYSTWNRRPSGENVFTPRSYSVLVKYISSNSCLYLGELNLFKRKIEGPPLFFIVLVVISSWLQVAIDSRRLWSWN
jgi:hypothetical protein